MGEPIGFPLSTAPGINPTESGGRLINGFAEKAPDGARGPYVWRRCAGLVNAFTVGNGAHRGALKFGTTAIIINGDTAYSVTKSGNDYTVSALTGTVPGTGPVIMARNMRSTPQIIIVHSEGQSKIESGTVSDFTDSDLPIANSVCFLDGYFIWGIGVGTAFSSGLNDVTVAGTDFATAEAKPDGIVRAVSVGSLLLLMGDVSTEIWTDAGNATGFPFSRSSVMPFGLYGTYAVAGFEEGFNDELLWVANDRTVRRRSGYDGVKVSTSDLDRLLSAVTDSTDLEASVYISSGHPIWALSTSEWTWEYDLSTGLWHERKSLGQERWRAHFGVNVFDEWLVFSTNSTSVFRIDPTSKFEDSEQLIWEVRSTQAHRFPGRAFIKQAAFDLEAGVGIDTASVNPQVEISWSDNGGRTFGNPVFRDLGRQGRDTLVSVFRAGLTGPKGRQWKLRVSDPVEVALYGGAMDVELRAA